MEELNYFGNGTGSSRYDNRRHFNLIYWSFLNVIMNTNDSFAKPLASNFKQWSRKQTSDWILNNFFTSGPIKYLSLIKIFTKSR